MIDPDGFRPNVAIVLMNDQRRVFWAQRANSDGWQFPQGGMRSDETPVEAMYRELQEETGLRPEHVELIGSTPGWLRYRLPRRYQRHHSKPLCIGQKQVWFLLRFLADEGGFSLDGCEQPEFCRYKWVDFWYPVNNVISFKRRVYRKALGLLEPMAENHLPSADLS
jgi:putative (di)nucleoside polyphosphate hydrolase